MRKKSISIRIACFAFLTAVPVAWTADATDPIVSVTGGEVQGKLWTDGSGAVFKGIPFAEPPVGNLRWREPMPVKDWKGIRAADAYPPACAQANAGWNAPDAKSSKEDCLYLNVWTPTWPPKSRYPVMLWIHGGGNAAGSGSGPLFDGESLASHGVVVVTIQYRLGMFGFLALPGLTKESLHHSSGNYSILDQIEALKWVHANIERFGGDSKQVTVFGQSAGAHDTGILLTSPLAKGLIDRAIEEGGTVVIDGKMAPSLVVAEQNGEKLVAILRPPETNAIEYLRGLTADDILKAAPPYATGGLDANVDGYVIPRGPGDAFATHKELPVPLLIGNNAREFTQPGSPDDVGRRLKVSMDPSRLRH